MRTLLSGRHHRHDVCFLATPCHHPEPDALTHQRTLTDWHNRIDWTNKNCKNSVPKPYIYPNEMLLNCFFFWMIVLYRVGDLIGRNYLKVHFWRVFISKARRSQASESPKSVVCVFVILYTRICNRKNSQKQPRRTTLVLLVYKKITCLHCAIVFEGFAETGVFSDLKMS